MDTLLQDMRFSLRSLARQPAFVLVSVAALALGIGANTAIFSVVNAVLLRPLPYADAERIVQGYRHQHGEFRSNSYSLPDIRDIQGQAPSIEALTGYSGSDFTVTGFGPAELIAGARVTNEILPVFHLAPQLGRDIRAEDAVSGGPRVAMISHRIWQERYGGAADVLERTVEIGGVGYEIVGVAPEGFSYPGQAELWLPQYIDLDDCGRGCHIFRVVASVAPGVSVDTANAELTLLAERLSDAYPDTNVDKGFAVQTLIESMVGDARRGLYVMLGAVGMVLLIACANVANLLLIRASGRSREIAVRFALGAGRGRIVRQLLVEAGVLAGLGGAVGLFLAVGCVRLLLALAPAGLPRAEGIRIDGPVLLFAIGVAALVSVAFGLVPAIRLARSPLAESLRRGDAGRLGVSPRSWSRAAFLTAEVALSLMLLLGAGLLQRSFSQISSVDLGYRTENIVQFALSLPESSYETPAETTRFFESLEENLAAVPGVESVGSIYGSPFGRNSIGGSVRLLDRPKPEPRDEAGARWHAVTPGYFATVGIPLLSGRGVEGTDRPGTQPVVVISESFARQYYPGEDPLGKQISMGVAYAYPEEEPRTVVGVVGDIRGRDILSVPEPETYVPMAQSGPDFLTLTLRVVPGADVMGAVRAEVRQLDPMVPIRYPETLAEVVGEAYGGTRFYAVLLSSFAAVALLLAAVGLYGVVGYLVAQRSHEIAIRMALGARRSEVVLMVLRQGVKPVVAGVVAGIVAAYYFSNVIASLLYNTDPADPLVSGAAAIALLLVTFIALLFPASRASRIEPMGVLKQG